MTERNFYPHVLSPLLVKKGEELRVDVALKKDAYLTAFEVHTKREGEDEFSPLCIIDDTDAAKLQKIGYASPKMVWASLHPKVARKVTLNFAAPHTGWYAVSQEKSAEHWTDDGECFPTITAKVRVENAASKKFRRLLGKCRRAISNLFG